VSRAGRAGLKTFTALALPDRMLASVAITDAMKASPATLANAKKQLAEGDANAAADRMAQAIANYQQAWTIVNN
jgi:hypothetical protein